MVDITGNAKHVATVAHSAILPIWKLQVLAGFQAIWRWRHSFRPDSSRLLDLAVETMLCHVRTRYVQEALRAISHWDDDRASATAIVLRAVK